jgi:thioredoxin-related protein
MKTVYLFVLAMLAISPLSAQRTDKVKWLSLEEALKLNAVAPRNILIDTYTDWCGWCKKMDAETFDHPVIAAYINKYFYAVKFDAESAAPVNFGGNRYEGSKIVNQNGRALKTTHQFATALGVKAYPTIVYMTGDFKVIVPFPGFQTAEDIEPWLHFFVDTNISFEEYKKRFVSDMKKVVSN